MTHTTPCNCNMSQYHCKHKKMKFMAMLTGFILGIIIIKMLSPRIREKASKWTDDLRDEIMDRVKETKDVTQEKYNQIIDEIRPKYESMKNVGGKELDKFIDELKAHWENIAQETKKSGKSGDQRQREETGRSRDYNYQESSNQME